MKCLDFFLLFLLGIQIISGVIPAKSSTGKDKSEISLLSLKISISMGFYILLLILEKLVPVIDIVLDTVLTVSVIWVDLDLYIDLTFSVLLIWGVSSVLLDACDFSVLLTVSIFFFYEIGGVMASSTTLGFVLLFLLTM